MGLWKKNMVKSPKSVRGSRKEEQAWAFRGKTIEKAQKNAKGEQKKRASVGLRKKKY